MKSEYAGRRGPRQRGMKGNMKQIGMMLALAVLAGSILAGCVVAPLEGRYVDRGYYGNGGWGYSANRDRDSYPSPNHSGTSLQRDR